MSEPIAQTLQRLINDGHTTAREIGEYIGVSPSTVYRWINGESQPDFHSIRLMLRHLSSKAAQQTLVTAFLAGSEWQALPVEVDLDVNGDGRIGPDDALDSSIHAVQAASESLTRIRESFRDGRMSSVECGRVLDILGAVITECTVTQHVLVALSDRKRAGR